MAFETLSHDGVEVAAHADISDEGQTVMVENPKPAIGTTATDGTDGDKTVIADMEAIIVDTVEYANLVPGEEYTLTGALYVKHVDEEGNVTEEAPAGCGRKPRLRQDHLHAGDRQRQRGSDVHVRCLRHPGRHGAGGVRDPVPQRRGDRGPRGHHRQGPDRHRGTPGGTGDSRHPPNSPNRSIPPPEPDKPQGTTYGKTGVSTMPIVAGIVLLIAAAGGTAFCAHRLHRKDGSDGRDE